MEHTVETVHNWQVKPFTIREARTEDAQTICGFLSDMEETVFDFELFEQLFTYNLRIVNNIYLVAVSNGNVVGYLSCHGQILLHHLGKVYEIQELYVDADHRGKGIGQALIQMLEQILSREDYKSLEVTPKTKRIAAHQFYTSNGFKNTHFKFTKEKYE